MYECAKRERPWPAPVMGWRSRLVLAVYLFLLLPYYLSALLKAFGSAGPQG